MLVGRRMNRPRARGALLLLTLSVLFVARANAQPPQRAGKRSRTTSVPVPAVEPTIEPKAIDILKAASDRLAAARAMRFTAVVSYENPSVFGPPVEYTTKSDVVVQRPNKLRVITFGDGPRSEFYYDGTTMMAYAPAENLVAVAPAPPTIDATLKEVYDRAATYW